MQFLGALKRFPRALLAGLAPVFSSIVRAPNSSSTAAPESDEQRIRAEVNRRKQRAREVGIITSTWESTFRLPATAGQMLQFAFPDGRAIQTFS